MDWGKKWLVDFNAGIMQLVSFYWSYNNGFIDVKMDGSVPEAKPSSKMLGLTFPFKLTFSSQFVASIRRVKRRFFFFNDALVRSLTPLCGLGLS